jgi:hypothetical protein
VEDVKRNPTASTPKPDGPKFDELESASPSEWGNSSLSRALRRARVEEAERSEVVAELRGAEMARLEMLQECLGPMLEQIPKDVDLFDVAIMPGNHPRLFIDMIAFVEMAHDRRHYRFVQDRRHGRILIAESERIDILVQAITDYVAHRLIEREKALASDGGVPHYAAASSWASEAGAAQIERSATPHRSFLFPALFFTIELVGATIVFALLAIGAWYAWQYALARL